MEPEQLNIVGKVIRFDGHLPELVTAISDQYIFFGRDHSSYPEIFIQNALLEKGKPVCNFKEYKQEDK